MTFTLPRTLRRLLHAPGFLATSVATLSLGLGANVAIFTLVHAVLIRPLPYPDAERLLGLWHAAPGLDLPRMPQSPALYLHYREHAKTLEAVALYQDDEVALSGVDRPERVSAVRATPSLAAVLGVGARHGRLFLPEEGEPGASPVVVLSDGLWQRRFGGDPGVLGRTVRVDGVSREIVGVLPPGVRFPDAETELWIPMILDPAAAPLGAFSSLGVGRLREGLDATDARAELDGMLARLSEIFPERQESVVLARAGLRALVHDLREDIVGDVAQALWILLGAVGLILLIACANVANLLLVRTESRQRELAIRSALGEGGLRRTASFLAESLWISAFAGVLGTGLALLGLRLIAGFGAADLPRLREQPIGGAVVPAAILLSLLAGLLLALVPSLRIALSRFTVHLSEAGRGATEGRHGHRAGKVLAATQVALALVLLIGSGLATLSFQRLSAVDPGFRSQGVLTFRVALPEAQYSDPERTARFHRRLVERLRALPGVRAVGATSILPLDPREEGTGHAIEDFPREESELPPVLYRRNVTSDYFRALGIPLIEGRSFDGRDAVEARPVAILSQALARHYWPDESPLGKRLRPGGPPHEGGTWYTVVGVVGSVRDRGLRQPPRELVYYPLLTRFGEEPEAPRGLSYALAVDGDPTQAVPAVREAVWALDASLPLAEVEPMELKLRRSKARLTFATVLLLVAATLALALGCVGLYGVVSYTVSQRLGEIAVRMAVGAARSDIHRLVLGDGCKLAAAGILLGLAGSATLARLMQAVLYEVDAFEPLVFAAMPLLPLLVALASSYLPAARAAGVDPARSLRRE